MMKLYLIGFLYILFLLISIEKGFMLCSAGNSSEEGRCEGFPECVCLRISNYTLNRKTKLVCENEINVGASFKMYLHPVRYLRIFEVFCDPDVKPKRLEMDFYNLLNLNMFQPEFHLLKVVSCPEPPMPYFSLIFPPNLLVQNDNKSISINSLYINCSDYGRKFSIERKHMYGLQSLKELSLYCHTMTDLPVDIFYNTTSSLSKITVESTQVLLLSNNSISSIFLDWRDDLRELRLLDLRYNKISRLQHQDVMFYPPNAPQVLPLNNIEKRILHPRVATDIPPAVPPPLTVDLRGNLIKSVDIALHKVKKIYLGRNGTVPEGIYGRATILLDDNPFTCDCSMLNFLRIMNKDVAPVSTLNNRKVRLLPARIEVGNLSCWEPKSVRGSLISEPENWIHHILPLIGLCSL